MTRAASCGEVTPSATFRLTSSVKEAIPLSVASRPSSDAEAPRMISSRIALFIAST